MGSMLCDDFVPLEEGSFLSTRHLTDENKLSTPGFGGW
jgi:hypothetical protein